MILKSWVQALSLILIVLKWQGSLKIDALLSTVVKIHVMNLASPSIAKKIQQGTSLTRMTHLINFRGSLRKVNRSEGSDKFKPYCSSKKWKVLFRFSFLMKI